MQDVCVESVPIIVIYELILERHHADIYCHRSDVRQQTLTEFENRHKCSEEKFKKSNNQVLNMEIVDLCPIGIVEKDGFKNLLGVMEPGYKIPCCKYFTCLLQGKILLKEKLSQNTQTFALTTDVWTSLSNEAHLSLTVHFISPEWDLNCCVLATSSFPGQHLGTNIAEKIKDIVKTFEIPNECVKAVVHDQRSNVVQKSGILLEEDIGWESVKFTVHKLQVCINQGLKVNAIARAVAAAKKLVGLKVKPLEDDHIPPYSLPPFLGQHSCTLYGAESLAILGNTYTVDCLISLSVVNTSELPFVVKFITTNINIMRNT